MPLLLAFSLLLTLLFVLAHIAMRLCQRSYHWRQLNVMYVPLEAPWPWSLFKSRIDWGAKLSELSKIVPQAYFGTFIDQSPILVLNDLDMIEEVLQDNCGHFLVHNPQLGSGVLLSSGQLDILTPLIDEMTYQLNEDLPKHVTNHTFIVERSIQKIWRKMLTLTIFGQVIQAEQESDFGLFQALSTTYDGHVRSGQPGAKVEYNRCCHALSTRQLERWSRDKKLVPDFVQFMVHFMNNSHLRQDIEVLTKKTRQVHEENEKHLDLSFVVALAIDVFTFGLDLFMECVNDCLWELAQDQDLQTKIQIEIDGIHAHLWDHQKCPNFQDWEGMQAIKHIIEDVFLRNAQEQMLVRLAVKDFKFKQDQLIIPRGQEVRMALSLGQQAFSRHESNKPLASSFVSRYLDPLSLALLKMTQATLMIVCRQFRFHSTMNLEEDSRQGDRESLRAELRMTPRSRKRKIGVVTSPLLQKSGL